MEYQQANKTMQENIVNKSGRPWKLHAKTHSEQVKDIFAKLFYFALTILCKLFLKKSTFFKGKMFGRETIKRDTDL